MLQHRSNVSHCTEQSNCGTKIVSEMLATNFSWVARLASLRTTLGWTICCLFWLQVQHSHHVHMLLILHVILREKWVIIFSSGVLSEVCHHHLNHTRTSRIFGIPEVPCVTVVPAMPVIQAPDTHTLFLKLTESISHPTQKGHRFILIQSWLIGFCCFCSAS